MHAENGVIRSKTLTKMSDHDQLATDREVQNFKAALRVRFQLKIFIPGPGRAVGPGRLDEKSQHPWRVVENEKNHIWESYYQTNVFCKVEKNGKLWLSINVQVSQLWKSDLILNQTVEIQPMTDI